MAVAEPPKAVQAPDAWGIYKRLPSMVLGFHGCDRKTADKVLSQADPHLELSTNEHDWLGSGIYFWESDPWRALEWANANCSANKGSTGKVEDPYVVGAVIDFGVCCNLLDYGTLAELELAYQFISGVHAAAKKSLPENKGGDDKFKRYRDKIVIDAMHGLRKAKGLPEYQTVRAAFLEGGKLYDGAGFERKNHIQIAVRDPSCIKAYFRLPGL